MHLLCILLLFSASAGFGIVYAILSELHTKIDNLLQ